MCEDWVFEVFQRMDWNSVSIVYSHLTYYELRMTHERKPSRSVSCFACAECSLGKGAFHSIQELEICFVVRIIKRNYKLKFCGLTVEKVSIPIIEPVSSLKQSIFWNVGRMSDFVDWKRTAWRWYTGSRKLIFLWNGFFSQSLTYTSEVFEKFWCIGI